MVKIVLDRPRIAALKYVDTDRLRPGTYDFPDFLIVGPQKTATTWLYVNLKQHPEVLFARPKEIFFLNLLDNPDHKQFSSSRLEWYSRHFRPTAYDYARAAARCLARRAPWPTFRVRGEASASYAAMDEELIAETVRLNPDIKVILLIRDPVERAWSHAKMGMLKHAGKRFEDYTFEDFKAFYSTPYTMRCGHFTANIERWRRRVADGHFLALVSERFPEDPIGHLTEVCQFLGVGTDPRLLSARAAFRRSNRSHIELPVPARHREFLMELLAEEIRRLDAAYGTRYGAVAS